jgi:hypothetical protein
MAKGDSRSRRAESPGPNPVWKISGRRSRSERRGQSSLALQERERALGSWLRFRKVRSARSRSDRLRCKSRRAPRERGRVRGQAGDRGRNRPSRPPVRAKRADLKRSTSDVLVGARGFEPPTTRSRTECATRLRYAPRGRVYTRFALPAQRVPVVLASGLPY